MTKVTMTPEKATQLLANNPNNRPVSRALVARYASDMMEALWKYNGDAVRVAKSGVLLDGQHRLLACIKSGRSFETELIEGLPDNVLGTIDGGRKRTAANILSIMNDHGATNVAILASGARHVLNYVYGMRASASQSTSAIVRLISKQPELADMAILAERARLVVPAGPLTGILFLGTRARGMQKRAEAFVATIKDGEKMESGDPRLALRNYYINARMRAHGNYLPRTDVQVIAIASAWNAFVTRKPLINLKPQSTREGSYVTPNIVGGPALGGLVSSLDDVRMHGNQARAIAPIPQVMHNSRDSHATQK